jgi:hypothetical protein
MAKMLAKMASEASENVMKIMATSVMKMAAHRRKKTEISVACENNGSVSGENNVYHQ